MYLDITDFGDNPLFITALNGLETFVEFKTGPLLSSKRTFESEISNIEGYYSTRVELEHLSKIWSIIDEKA